MEVLLLNVRVLCRNPQPPWDDHAPARAAKSESSLKGVLAVVVSVGLATPSLHPFSLLGDAAFASLQMLKIGFP